MIKKLTEYLSNPLIIIFIGFFLAYLLSPYNGFLSLVILFLLSLLIILFQQKWLKLLFSTVLYAIFFILWIIVGAFNDIQNDLYHTKIGDASFYKNELKQSSNLEIPSEMDLIAKIDTIRYIGFEGEYDAECLYKGSKKVILKLQKAIESNKEFIKNDSINFERSDVVQKEKINNESFKYGYTKSIEGRCIINIAFNKTKTSLYYSAFYY